MGKNKPETYKKYWAKWYPKNKARVRKSNKAWRQSNKDLFDVYRKKWAEKNPYFTHYSAARGRCLRGKYKDKGIKFLLTGAEVKEAYIRDKAHLLKKASIDRIDSSGNYTPENIRFIELDENRLQGARAPKRRVIR